MSNIYTVEVGENGMTKVMLTDEAKTWYNLKHGPVQMRIQKVPRDNGPPGRRVYLEYILSDLTPTHFDRYMLGEEISIDEIAD
jgi:hypothetical protein